MQVWNKRDIPGPPEYTVEYTPSDRGKLDHCIQKLLKCVIDGQTVLCDGEVSDSFKREVAVLAASLYQNGRHRTEKFYKVLKKVQKCCEQWKELNLGSVFNKLLHLMPLNPPPPQKSVRIPSKQMFVYLCVRLMGGWHLLWQLEGYCREAATYLMAKISSGHFFCTALAFLANTGRLRALALDMCGQLSMLYEDVLSVLHYLQSSDTPGVVPGACLPPSLSKAQSSRTTNACSCILQDKDTEKCPKSSSSSSREGEGTKDEKSICSNTCIIETESKDDRQQAAVMQEDEDLGICVEEEERHVTPVHNTKKHKKMKTGILKQVAASQVKLKAEKKRNPSPSNTTTIKVQLKSDRSQTSVILQDEDIGICVEEEQHLGNSGCNTKKNKAIKKVK